MNQNILTGIGIGGTLCAVGIAYSPNIPLVPEAAAVFAAGLGGIALLVATYRHHPASVGVGATALVLLGGYALAAGILTGPAALGTAALMAGAGILLGRTLLRGGVSWQRLQWGGSA